MKTIAVLTFASAAFGQGSTMPAIQQNALVQQYCAVCHTAAKLAGGLSLETFDATHLDPSLAAMLAGKLKGGAMGASGIAVPDRTTQDALLRALSAQAEGATDWTVTETRNPATQGSILTASFLRESPSPTSAGMPEMYRLALSCHVDTHEAGIQLTWAPTAVPWDGSMSVAVDENAKSTYKVNQGDASALLSTSEKAGAPAFAMHLPERTLTIGNVFPGQTIVFPFAGLNPAFRQRLSACFMGRLR